jgi:hypothetical protein
MAIRHYYIGVGGTGARVAEALVHLCAAGLGPDELFLMLVDPDAGNGNLSRTTELIAKYQDAQKQIGARAPEVATFRTKIVTPDPVVWTIFQQQNQTLASFIGLSSLEASARPLKHFAEMLFSEGDLGERLNEGFRGRPAIGAVVMAQPDTSVPPWSRFWEEIGKVNRADEAKVFVVGSIFGGTGAAGIPTLGAAAVLRDRAALDAERQKSKIYLGACLVLPYFTFEQNVPVEERARLFVTAEDFPLATSSALHYYLAKQLAYDEMYFIGDSGGEVVGQFGAGAARQKNRAHYVELGAALSALDFYGHGAPTPARERQYFISARAGDAVGWEALPVARHADLVGDVQAAVRYRLIAAATFFYALAAYGRETLDAMTVGGKGTPTWFEHFQVKKGVGEERLDPRAARQREAIGHLEAFGERFLAWLRELHVDRSVALLNVAALLDEGGALLRWESAPIGQLAGDGASPLRFPKLIADCLNHDSLLEANTGSTGADRYFNLFALAANRFAHQHLNVPPPQGAR